jgi:hypothetical protein
MRALVSAIAAAAFSFAVPAHSAIIIDLNEIGSNVVATGSGSIDLTGLIPDQNSFVFPAVNGSSASVAVGFGGFSTFYSGLFGPALFGSGSGGVTFASAGSGQNFGLGFGPLLIVPLGYGSGGPLFGGAIWLGQSYASLGLTPGQYVFTAPQDTVTINIRAVDAAVPEPSTWAMMLLGFGAIGFAFRHRKGAPSSQPA